MTGYAKMTAARSVRNVLSNWGGFFFTAVIGFFLAPYVLRKLGTTPYGVWVLLASLVGYLGLLDLGVRSAVTKFIASYHSAGNHEGASAMKSAALFMFTVAGFLAISLAVGISPFVDRIFTIPPELETTARIVIVVCAANIAVALIGGVYGGILAARHRFDLLNLVDVALVIARSTAIVVALEAKHGIVSLAVIQLLSSTSQMLLIRTLSFQAYPEAVTTMQQAFCTENIRKLFSFGLISSSIHILGAVAHNSALIIIGSLLPVALVTYFSIAQSLTEYARTLMSGISQTITPMVGAMDGAQQSNSVGRVFVDGTRYANLVILPIVATFIVRGESFISLWMGAEYSKLSGQILVILSISLWAMAGYQICTSIMIGLGKHRGMVPIFGFEAVANIGLSISLISVLGVVGAAWGALIPRLIVALILSVMYAKKVLLISFGEYYLNAIVRPIIAILPFAVVSYGLDELWLAKNLVVFFLQVTLVFPVAMAGIWIFALEPAERITCVRTAKRLGNFKVS